VLAVNLRRAYGQFHYTHTHTHTRIWQYTNIGYACPRSTLSAPIQHNCQHTVRILTQLYKPTFFLLTALASIVENKPQGATTTFFDIHISSYCCKIPIILATHPHNSTTQCIHTVTLSLPGSAHPCFPYAPTLIVGFAHHPEVEPMLEA
jgi:hypothetical protein